MRADHDIRVRRVRPFRHPSAFLEVLKKGRDHAIDTLRRKQSEQAVFGAERVPDRISRVAFAGVRLIVEGTVVVAIFGEDPRVEQRVIESRVEASSFAIGGAFQFETAQLFRPCGMQLRAHRVEIPVRDLVPEIRAGLIDAQERCADTDFHQLARAKFGECSPARGRVLFLKAVGSGVLWSLPELNDEVAFEVRQLMRPQVRIHAVRIIAGDLARFWINGGKARDARPGHFDQHARDAGARKPEAKKCATLRGRHFGADARAFRDAERHGIVIRLCGFVAVGESESASFRRCAEFADLRHQGDVTVVAHPDGRLMSADEAGNGRVVVLIRRDADLVLAGLRRPVRHCERR